MSESSGDHKLDLALDAVAEALASLLPAKWARLCQREPAEIISMMQLFALGVPDVSPPEMLLGRLIMERLER